ncbi:hypothetical protein IM043_gp229 [Bacillus phage SPG24]|nr:hypothetical protein IM043_gp229 [Bacillus phage SPG24]
MFGITFFIFFSLLDLYSVFPFSYSLYHYNTKY